MELPAIGRVANPEELDLDPIVIPIVGYDVDKEEVIERFSFRPVQPAGAAMDMLRMTDSEGNVPLAPVMRWLDAALMPEDSDRWREFLNRGDVFIEQTVLIDIYKALSSEYAARPTMPRSGSPSGRSSTTQTSRAASRSRAKVGSKTGVSAKP